MPSFAAIVANYNDGARIGAALASLYGQSRPFDEILIIDDGSTDDSVAVITRLIAERKNVRFLQHAKNEGVVATLNTGIRECSTEFLLLCSANDAFDTRLVERCSDALIRYPDAGMVTGDTLLSERPQSTPNKARTIRRELSLPHRIQYYSPSGLITQHRRAPIHFSGGANMLRTSLVRRYGGLLKELQWHADWLIYQLIAFDSGIVYVPELFSTTFMDDDSYSRNINVWEKQKPVLDQFFRLLPVNYAAMADSFRDAALLPAFHLGNPLILFRKDVRWIVTPLLLWRVVVHGLFYGLKRLAPRPLLMRIRTWFRV